MIRELQPNAVIWNDGGDRGDLRRVGTEAGNVGETNWSLMPGKGDTSWHMLHYGVEDGDSEGCTRSLHFFYGSAKQVFIDWDTEQTVSAFRYMPSQNTREGTVTHYSLWASTNWADWIKVVSGEFSNIVNNPIWQTIKFAPVKAKVLRLDADRLAEGDRLPFYDCHPMCSAIHD